MIIGMIGFARHGKNTAGETLEKVFRFKQVALADKLKEFALAINPFIVIQADERYIIEKYFCSAPPKNPWFDLIVRYFNEGYDNRTYLRLSTIVDSVGWEEAKGIADVRRTLQRTGTEGGRDVIDKNIWLNALFSELSPSQSYVITDVHFPDEVDRIRSEGGQVWRIHRPGFNNGLGVNHSSEAYIAEIKADQIILNDGSKEDLQSNIIQTMYHSGLIMNGLGF